MKAFKNNPSSPMYDDAIVSIAASTAKENLNTKHPAGGGPASGFRIKLIAAAVLIGCALNLLSVIVYQRQQSVSPAGAERDRLDSILHLDAINGLAMTTRSCSSNASTATSRAHIPEYCGLWADASANALQKQMRLKVAREEMTK